MRTLCSKCEVVLSSNKLSHFQEDTMMAVLLYLALFIHVQNGSAVPNTIAWTANYSWFYPLHCQGFRM